MSSSGRRSGGSRRATASRTAQRRALEEWLRFVRGESHVLQRYPDLLFQQAANQHDSGTPASAARALWEAGARTRPWFRRVDESRDADADCVLTLWGPTSPWACGFSTDGDRILSFGGSDLAIWDAVSGRDLASYGPVAGCSPDLEMVLVKRHDHLELKAWRTDATLARIPCAPGDLYRCAVSPTGRRIALGFTDGRFAVWDDERGPEPTTLRVDPSGIAECAFSPDGRMMAVNYGNTVLRLWQVDGPTEVGTITAEEGGTPIRFSPDGHRLLWGLDQDFRIRIWSLETGQEEGALEYEGGSPVACDFSPDGRRLVLGTADGLLGLWDVDACERSWLEPHSTADVCGVLDCRFSHDGLHVASASGDRTVGVWDARTGSPVARFTGSPEWVERCGFSPDDSLIVSASQDGTVRVWDVARGRSAAQGIQQRARKIGFSPDGAHVLAGALFDARTGSLIRDFWDEGVQDFAYSPDGRRVVSVHGDSSEETGEYSGSPIVRLRDGATGEELARLCGEAEMVECGFSPDGGQIMAAGRSPDYALALFWKTDRFIEVKLWNASAGEERTIRESHSNRPHTDWEHAYAYSPDGSRLAAIASSSVRVWDARTAADLLCFTAHARTVRAFEFFPDGRSVLSLGIDGTLALWDAWSGMDIAVLAGRGDPAHACSVSPDGRLIVSVGAEGRGDDARGTLTSWDVGVWERSRNFTVHDAPVTGCRFSPDGRWMITHSSDATLRAWDRGTGEEIVKYFAGEPIRAVDLGLTRGAVALNNAASDFFILHLLGIECAAPIVSAVYLYRFDLGRWDGSPTAGCAWCARRFEPARPVLDAIRGIARCADLTPDRSPCLELPREAWDEPRLISECSRCQRPLLFNPFLVDNRDGR